MKKGSIIATAAIMLSAACTENPEQNQAETKTKMEMEYPETRKDSTVDEYFGTQVPDPYRWLEDDRSAETEAWVTAQNEVSFGYLEQIPYRDALKNKLTELWNYEKLGAPFEHGDFTYFYKNNGLQNQYVVYRFKTGEGSMDNAEVFLDPNTFAEDGSTSLGGMSFTKDGSLCAYQISEGGSDWRKVIIIDALSMEQIGDTLKDVKFSGLSWRGNEGFYYSSYDKPEAGSQLTAMTDMHKLFFHKMGASQAEDELIFGGEKMKRRYIGGYVSEDEQYLIISAAESTTGNELYIQKLESPNAPIVSIVSGFDSDQGVIHTDGNKVYFKTNMNAPNGRVAMAEFPNLDPENWVDVIPQTEHVLTVGTAGGKFFTTYMIDAVHKVYQYNTDGAMEREIELPGPGSVGGFGGRWDDEELYYSFTNYINPGTTFKYNIGTGESELYRKSAVAFDSELYESKQVFYTSKDGTKVPMIITHKKGLEMDGNNPTMLYGYGGFNVSLTPRFSTSNIVWLQQGGVYAVANLRGGGEYGEEWHEAGTLMNKQNVFDDFIAAAEYLQSEQYTRPEKLAIHGGSNGGLLVGATMLQRPELFAVALPAVGVLDMLRYHEFTAGAGWHTDYGTADDSKEMFDYLKAYSPLHNVKEGIDYPATMVTTGDHDDRVVPAHSFKFAAELQAKYSGDNPMLIRIETNAGHGAGKPTDKIIQEQADKWAFSLSNMGYESLPQPYTEGAVD
ncbi:MAG: prolyl oligopeptidase family serine peptidase [Croceimicrobium sp.]